MLSNLKMCGRGAIAAAIVAFTIGCTVSAKDVSAQSQTQHNDIPVLVMGEDSDPTTVKRSSDIFKRVIAELKGSMKRHGFRMVDEDSVAADLGWQPKDRRPKLELLQLAKLMSQSGKAVHRVRAMVLFRIHAAAKDLGGATQVQTRIDGEIYDTVTNEFLGTFEMPRKTYPAPADCLSNRVCISEIVGDKAREIAAGLGTVLAKKLDRYHDDSVAGSGGGSVTGVASGDGHGLITPYTVTMRYFDTREALTIIGVMADEFPGYKSHSLIEKQPAIRKYEYVTSAKSTKMEEWISILLIDMNYDVDRDVEVLINGSEVIIAKLSPTDQRPVSDDEKARFN